MPTTYNPNGALNAESRTSTLGGCSSKSKKSDSGPENSRVLFLLYLIHRTWNIMVETVDIKNKRYDFLLFFIVIIIRFHFNEVKMKEVLLFDFLFDSFSSSFYYYSCLFCIRKEFAKRFRFNYTRCVYVLIVCICIYRIKHKKKSFFPCTKTRKT